MDQHCSMIKICPLLERTLSLQTNPKKTKKKKPQLGRFHISPSWFSDFGLVGSLSKCLFLWTFRVKLFAWIHPLSERITPRSVGYSSGELQRWLTFKALCRTDLEGLLLKYSLWYVKSVQLCSGFGLVPCLQKGGKTWCCVLTLTDTVAQER